MLRRAFALALVLCLAAPSAAAEEPGSGLGLDRVLDRLRDWLPGVHRAPDVQAPAPVLEPEVSAGRPSVHPPGVEEAVEEVKEVVPPVADFRCASSSQGTLVHLRDESRHLDGRILLWSWDFGDGSTLVVQTASANPKGHTYDEVGVHVVKLTVKDQDGIAATVRKACTALPIATDVDALRRTQVLDEDPLPRVAPYAASCGVATVPRAVPEVQAFSVLEAPMPRIDPCEGSAQADRSEVFAAQPALASGAGGSISDVQQAPGVESPAPAEDGPAFHTVPQEEAEPATVTVAPEEPEVAPAVAAVGLGVGALALLGFRFGWMRRFLGLLGMAGFTRLKDDELLEHPVRLHIVQAVAAEPGIHYQALVRVVEKGNGVLEHHLRMLCQAGLVRQRSAGGYTCYFPAHTDRRLMDAQSVLKAEVARRILDRLVVRPGEGVGELAKDMGVTSKAVSYHLKRFENAGLVRLQKEGRSLRVFPNALAMQATGPAEAAA